MGSLYTKYKIFHFQEKLDSLPKSVADIRSPIHIRIKPTNVCNHRCSYCAYRSDDLQLGKDMSVKDFIPKEKMLEVIDDVTAMGVKSITFSGGGEPFCYPYLLDAVKKLSETSVKFAALTNGARLEGEVARIFAHHATWLRVSMDGWDDKSYMDYRGVPDGEFTKILANINNFKQYQCRCYLGVSIIVDRKNATHVFDLAKTLKDNGVNSIKISPCIISNHGWENNDYHALIFDEVKKQITRIRRELESHDFKVFDSYHRQLESFSKDYTWCPYLQILPVIGADQNIYPCQDKAYNLDEGLIGSIKNQRFKDFWFSKKNKFYKINPSRVCNHHCVANAKNEIILDYLNADSEHLVFV